MIFIKTAQTVSKNVYFTLPTGNEWTQTQKDRHFLNLFIQIFLTLPIFHVGHKRKADTKHSQFIYTTIEFSFIVYTSRVPHKNTLETGRRNQSTISFIKFVKTE